MPGDNTVQFIYFYTCCMNANEFDDPSAVLEVLALIVMLFVCAVPV